MWWLLIGASVVCGVSGSYVAVEKDRPSLEGLVLGGLLGPLGVLIAVLMPQGYPPIERSYIAGRMDRCKEEIREGKPR